MKPFSVSVSQDPYRENDPNIFGFLKGINIEKKTTKHRNKLTIVWSENKKSQAQKTVSFNSLLVGFGVFDVGAEKSEDSHEKFNSKGL